jgi:hypothetical protein
MSHALISRSPDLKRLRDEGYDVEIRYAHLLLKDVPYVNSRCEVKRGILVSELTMAGEVTGPPSTHVASFSGEYPCNRDGRAIEQIRHQSSHVQLGEALVVQHSFSSKPVPEGRYADYYEKMTTYAAILSSPACALNPSVTPRTHPVIPTDGDDSIFRYLDTASSRAKIGMVTSRIALAKIAIVGLGGTGAYVLDLIAKTPVKEIHLFDDDTFYSHNAFRAPGAASVEELNAAPRKVSYFRRVYSKMRSGILAHEYAINVRNVAELLGMDFVFLCADPGEGKKAIVDALSTSRIPFVDVGMGVELVDGSLRGILRVTTSTPNQRAHVAARVSLSDAGRKDEYDQNIQIADLNALNAALAVIKYKKLFGFYVDLDREHHSTYTLDGNQLTNDVKT